VSTLFTSLTEPKSSAEIREDLEWSREKLGRVVKEAISKGVIAYDRDPRAHNVKLIRTD